MSTLSRIDTAILIMDSRKIAWGDAPPSIVIVLVLDFLRFVEDEGKDEDKDAL